jgi:asparagine synthase (glutamine-hydrolysing)
MCGIAGILGTDRHPADASVLARMCQALFHRGPDDDGYYHHGPVGLGQRRLSIIDLATGHQPLGNEDGTVWVTFNGEIYNFQELRPELERRGHRFATHSDTEAIVHAYEEFGPECVRRFRGMFAFAVWDGRRRSLFLARDRVGKKPLFYATAGGQFAFASELQGLLPHPDVRRDLDPQALDDYLTYGYVPAPRTIFRGVFKLPPAHHLTVRLGEDGAVLTPDPECYWRLEYGPKAELDEEAAAEGLLEVLTEAVRLRLIADVPLGALLSGGIDSGVVVALMSRLAGKQVRTFSIGFDETEFNELPYAREVARRYGTEHHEFVVRPKALEVLPTLIRHYGEPYADSSAVPSYYVAQMTRQHVKVALNGDGGDECFAGYERYLGSRVADRYRRLPRVLRQGVVEPLSALIPGGLPRRHRLSQLKRFLEVAGQPFPVRYLRWVGYLTPGQKEELYTPEFRDLLEGYDGRKWLLGEFDQVQKGGPDPLDAVLALDVRSYLPYDLLVKMDIATMANSLEARSPFLDHKVMEFAARLPGRFKIRGATLKYLLRKVARDLLPPRVLQRRKMGFGVPVGQWMRDEFRPMLEDVLLGPQARTRRYFHEAPLRRMVAAHVEGRQEHAFRLWALLWLELWHREFLP